MQFSTALYAHLMPFIQRTPNEYRHNPYIHGHYLNLQLGQGPPSFPSLSFPFLPSLSLRVGQYVDQSSSRGLEKFGEDTLTSPEVIRAQTLHFKPNVNFSRLNFLVGPPSQLWCARARLGQCICNAYKTLRGQLGPTVADKTEIKNYRAVSYRSSD